MELKGKVAIVTGSGRGIGKATALALAEKGCNVVVAARTLDEIVSTAKEIQKMGGKAIAVKADVGSSKDVKDLVAKTMKEFGRIDVLVNNAGVLYNKPLAQMSEREWDETVNTNLRGIYLCDKEVLPQMIKQKRESVIVNISSGAGHTAYENMAAYCATKSGVLAINSSLAEEVGKHGIKVFTVCPGMTATKMVENWIGPIKYKLTKNTMMQPEKIAQKIVDVCMNSHRLTSGKCFDVFN
ncbi:MAG: SDR family oxidoreductase [Candidatus Aenigmarchaeota archaeon]|nr:SDR family oxidoreductase [Candidatus Aenigmarchaeota archaeon]